MDPFELHRSKEQEMKDHMIALAEEKKTEILTHYTALKLQIPSYLRNRTIGELRALNVELTPDFFTPVSADEHFRKLARLEDHIREYVDDMKKFVQNHYASAKKIIPPNVLNKKMEDISLQDLDILDPSLDCDQLKEAIAANTEKAKTDL